MLKTIRIVSPLRKKLGKVRRTELDQNQLRDGRTRHFRDTPEALHSSGKAYRADYYSSLKCHFDFILTMFSIVQSVTLKKTLVGLRPPPLHTRKEFPVTTLNKVQLLFLRYDGPCEEQLH